jgi:hypothetical protein
LGLAVEGILENPREPRLAFRYRAGVVLADRSSSFAEAFRTVAKTVAQPVRDIGEDVPAVLGRRMNGGLK